MVLICSSNFFLMEDIQLVPRTLFCFSICLATSCIMLDHHCKYVFILLSAIKLAINFTGLDKGTNLVTNLPATATSQVTRQTRRLLSQTSPPF